jgi:hypothetical protein
MTKSEIILYKTQDSDIIIDVLVENENIWLTQAQMGTLFAKDRRTVGEHIRNVFKEGELDEKVVCRKFQHTTQHSTTSVLQRFFSSGSCKTTVFCTRETDKN